VSETTSDTVIDADLADDEATETDAPEAFDADVVDVVDVVEETPAPAPRTPRPIASGPVGATGRRKQAIARVRLVPGSGTWSINGRTLTDYFPNKVHQQIVNEPFTNLDIVDGYDVLVRVHGGGISGQAGAVRLGIARALIEADTESRPSLKKAGFLTRDPRAKERKKYGLKKARKAPQYSKR
jgi:small subunit ribosomal protein S9